MSIDHFSPRLLLLTGALALTALGVGCDRHTPAGDKGAAADGKEQKSAKSDDNGAKGKGKGRRDAGPAAVRTETAVLKVMPATISVVDALAGRQQAEVYSKVVGRISSLGPKEGEAVKAGTVLFRVDRADPGESFLSTPVVSPISGWIGRWNATSIGEQVTTTMPVVTIVDDDVLRATVDLPTREWLLVNKDTSIKVNVGDDERTGKVTAISRSGDAASGRGTVTIEIANPGRTWRVGMVARISLGLEPRPRIVIPSTALTITDKGAFVYVVKDEKAARVAVRFALIDADAVEITEGVKDGDQVVITGTNMLSDQAAVRIVDPAAAPQGG